MLAVGGDEPQFGVKQRDAAGHVVENSLEDAVLGQEFFLERRFSVTSVAMPKAGDCSRRVAQGGDAEVHPQVTAVLADAGPPRRSWLAVRGR